MRRRPRRTRSEASLLRVTALRLGAQAALTVAAIVALLAGVAVLVVLQSQRTDALNLVRDTAQRADDVNDPPSGVWMTLQTSDSRKTTKYMPAGLPDEVAINRVLHNADPSYVDIEDLHTGGHEYLVRTERRDAATVVQAALDRHADTVERTRLLTGLLLSGGLGLILAALAGMWLGSRAVRPMSNALALQRRFVADASHELRTPLTLLSTRAQLLRRQLSSDEADLPAIRSDVDGLVLDARHLTEIMEDLLLAADPGGRTPAEPVDVTELAAAVTEASSPAADRLGIAIRCSTPASTRVLGAPVALRRAVTALVDNAVRHARSTVDLSVSAGLGGVVIEVRDDGPGIDPEMLPRLFDRFYSTGQHTGQTRRYGLGLALVSEIAVRHGGAVRASNAPTGGAVFRLTLPRGPSGGVQGGVVQ